MRQDNYVGHIGGQESEVFQSEDEPTKESHPKYDFCTGPFESLKKASSYKRWFDSNS